MGQKASNKELCEAFDECLRQLQRWRSSHIAIVSKYIVRPARLAKRNESSVDERSSNVVFEAVDGEDLKGTAGSALIPFLRQSRDETVGMN